MTKLRLFIKGEIHEFLAFPFSLHLIFDQTLSKDCRTVVTRFYYVYMLCNLHIKKGTEELKITQLLKLVIIVEMKESGNNEWIEITKVIIVTNDNIRMGFRRLAIA